jgi:hypothetical protein
MASATWGGGITSAEGLRDWGRRAVPLFNYTLAFALQLRKSTENLSQGSRVVGDYAGKLNDLYRVRGREGKAMGAGQSETRMKGEGPDQ